MYVRTRACVCVCLLCTYHTQVIDNMPMIQVIYKAIITGLQRIGMFINVVRSDKYAINFIIIWRK